MDKHFPPAFEEKAYTCPFCNVFAEQVWYTLDKLHPHLGQSEVPGYRLVICRHCDEVGFWKIDAKSDSNIMIYPKLLVPPLPVDGMPPDVKTIYNEARDIHVSSPRAAVALLRLAIELLVRNLGEGDNLNKAIGNLVKRGLPGHIQKALDSVRVIGNQAVHPGQIETAGDQEEIALAMFGLLNFIVEKMISEPQQIDAIYANLPEGAKEAIKNRDS